MGGGWIAATGMSSGLGQALLHDLTGRRIAVFGRRSIDRPEVRWISCDFRRPPDQWSAPVQEWLLEESPRIKGFVHAAGAVFSDQMERTTSDEWSATLNVNLTAAFVLGQLFSPYFVEGASVVLVGSVDSGHASSDGPAAAYGAAKAGLRGLVRQWAWEWGSRSIRVNGVALGALTSGSGPAAEAVETRVAGRTALGRLG